MKKEKLVKIQEDTYLPYGWGFEIKEVGVHKKDGQKFKIKQLELVFNEKTIIGFLTTNDCMRISGCVGEEIEGEICFTVKHFWDGDEEKPSISPSPTIINVEGHEGAGALHCIIKNGEIEVLDESDGIYLQDYEKI